MVELEQARQERIWAVAGPLFLVNAEGVLQAANPALEQYLCLQSGQAVGRLCSDLGSCSLCRTPVCPLEKASRQGGSQTFETSVLLADGRTVICSVSRLECEDSLFVVQWTDVTALATRLDRAEKELKEFAYIVSHDLKAPVRAVKTLVDWFCSDYGDKVDADGREQLSLLLNRADRLNNLIEGVLQYSRIGRICEEPKDVDLNKEVPEVVAILNPPAHIRVTIDGTLPAVRYDRTRIREVFQYLIGNAIKFMDKPEGRISVGCTEGPSAWTFSVRDNGSGINAEHFDRIFRIFQTLAPRDEVESTGVGLTLAKKIVEHHGGTLSVESQVGQGSTFSFTVNKAGTGTSASG